QKQLQKQQLMYCAIHPAGTGTLSSAGNRVYCIATYPWGPKNTVAGATIWFFDGGARGDGCSGFQVRGIAWQNMLRIYVLAITILDTPNHAAKRRAVQNCSNCQESWLDVGLRANPMGLRANKSGLESRAGCNIGDSASACWCTS